MTEENKTRSLSLIREEIQKLIDNTKRGLQDTKVMAIGEAWKLLQIAIASVVQIIEAIGKDLAGSEKKDVAMEMLSKFYDSVFMVIDIPFIPNLIEPYIHKHVKSFLMVLVGSTIDSMVTVFRNTGVFLRKSTELEV